VRGPRRRHRIAPQPSSPARSSRILRRIGVGIAALAIGVLGLPAPFGQAITSANAITYVYDDLGRLEAVIDPGQTNGMARYTYDGAGNLLSIARQSSTATSIVDFQPKTAKRDGKVTIYGAGFSATPADNTVKFAGSSGTAASVISATTTQLVVDIPDSGSINGTMYVQASGGSATSTQQFAEDASAAPTISGFSPTVATTGTAVTISGSGFDATSPAMNNVFLNGIRMQVTAASASSLTAIVPPFLTAGQIQVQTRKGQATSSTDLFVPPANNGVPYGVADVENTGRTTLGTQASVTVSSLRRSRSGSSRAPRTTACSSSSPASEGRRHTSASWIRSVG
jgi:YD repeat-containing protein